MQNVPSFRSGQKLAASDLNKINENQRDATPTRSNECLVSQRPNGTVIIPNVKTYNKRHPFQIYHVDQIALKVKVNLGDVLWTPEAPPSDWTGYTKGVRFPSSGAYTELTLITGVYNIIFIAQPDDTTFAPSLYCNSVTSMTNWNANSGNYPELPRSSGTNYWFRAAHVIGLVNLSGDGNQLIFQRVKGNLRMAPTIYNGRQAFSFYEG